MLIDIKEYCISRNWETRVSAMPNIPRGSAGFPESLRLILLELKKGIPLNTKVLIPGSEGRNTLEDLLIRLRPTGIVKKVTRGWEISKEMKFWLESKNDLNLALFLSYNIKFFSEILAILSEDSKVIKEIREIASSNYKLEWKTKSEILARLNWLKDLGLVNYKDFSMEYSITSIGLEFLNVSGYVNYCEIETPIDATIHEKTVPISSWAEEFCLINEEDHDYRKTSMGYFPGSMQVAHSTTLDYLFLMREPTELSTLIEYSAITFGISESSTKQFLSTLLHLGFIERKSKTLYQAKDIANLFSAENFDIDFTCCIHKKYAFVFEILFELQKENLSAKQLAVIAKVSYDFPSEDSSNVNKRINILKNAKLIQEYGMNTYTLTNRGEIFCEEYREYYQVQKVNSTINERLKTNFKDDKVDTLLNELRISCRDSTNPDRFEEVLSKAFALLGFKSEWMGGSGQTDILIQAPTSPKFTYIVAIDAKTTYSGGITESQINFDTIIDHRKKHNADYSVIVGCEFRGERLIERAIKHNVVLLDIEQLEDLIKMHVEVPLKSDSYRKMFNQKGIIDIGPITADRNKIIRDGTLLQILMKCISEEGDDPLTQGIMQPREIYLLLKNRIELNPSPSIEEIKQMLDFLSSPLIGCIGFVKEGYYAIGSLSDAAQKFDFYLKACRD